MITTKADTLAAFFGRQPARALFVIGNLTAAHD